MSINVRKVAWVQPPHGSRHGTIVERTGSEEGTREHAKTARRRRRWRKVFIKTDDCASVRSWVASTVDREGCDGVERVSAWCLVRKGFQLGYGT